jgi:hypothetical protein
MYHTVEDFVSDGKSRRKSLINYSSTSHNGSSTDSLVLPPLSKLNLPTMWQPTPLKKMLVNWPPWPKSLDRPKEEIQGKEWERWTWRTRVSWICSSVRWFLVWEFFIWLFKRLPKALRWWQITNMCLIVDCYHVYHKISLEMSFNVVLLC